MYGEVVPQVAYQLSNDGYSYVDGEEGVFSQLELNRTVRVMIHNVLGKPCICSWIEYVGRWRCLAQSYGKFMYPG